MVRRELISQAAYARRRGISQTAVWKRTTTVGGPIPVYGPRKRIDPAEADPLWEGTKTLQGEASAPAAARGSNGGTYQEAKTAKMVVDAQRAALELRVREGQLVDRRAAERAAEQLLRRVRDSFLRWPARVAPGLASAGRARRPRWRTCWRPSCVSSSTSSPTWRCTWMAMDRPPNRLDTGVAVAGGRGLRPAAALTVSEWAETYRMWAGRSVAEAGRYRIARTPYIREVIDCLSDDSPIQRLVVMKAARLGFTEGVVLNAIGYYLHHAPAPCLLVLPTLTLAQRVARESLEPMLFATPELRVRIGTPRGRGDLRATLLFKEVPNGSIALVGANSAAALRQTAAKLVLVGELDACPRDVEGEGSPLAIAEARARTFRPTRKVVLVSSPTEKGRSLIEAEFLQTDQRRYEVPCPFCDRRQVLTLDGLTWEPGQPETARYLCAECRRPITEGHKAAMLAAGTWVATARGAPRRRGYHLSSDHRNAPRGRLATLDLLVARPRSTGGHALVSPALTRRCRSTPSRRCAARSACIRCCRSSMPPLRPPAPACGGSRRARPHRAR